MDSSIQFFVASRDGRKRKIFSPAFCDFDAWSDRPSNTEQMRRFQLGSRKLDDFGERCRMMNRQIRQYLPVDADLFLIQASNQAGIGNVVHPCRSIDARNPERAEFTLLGPSVTVCVCSSFVDVMLCNSMDLAPGTPKSFGLRQELLPSPVCCDFVL
jgi:hypothetical protein